jgi:ribosomal protein S18 acetylase RimI-like enzyme
MYHYKTGTRDVDWWQLYYLYEKVGLARDLARSGEFDKLRASFEASYRVATAWHGGDLVGAARMISDGICYGMIFDVAVLAEHRQKGLGKGLMTELMKDNGHLCIYLTSTFGNEKFYEKLGFKRHKTAYGLYPHSSRYLE